MSQFVDTCACQDVGMPSFIAKKCATSDFYKGIFVTRCGKTMPCLTDTAAIEQSIADGDSKYLPFMNILTATSTANVVDNLYDRCNGGKKKNWSDFELTFEAAMNPSDRVNQAFWEWMGTYGNSATIAAVTCAGNARILENASIVLGNNYNADEGTHAITGTISKRIYSGQGEFTFVDVSPFFA